MEGDELSSTFCGSTVYAAPEILASSDDYNAFYSDIWSCGIILYAMFTAKLPFDREKLTRFAEYQIVEGNFESKWVINSTRVNSVNFSFSILDSPISEKNTENHDWAEL